MTCAERGYHEGQRVFDFALNTDQVVFVCTCGARTRVTAYLRSPLTWTWPVAA